MNLPTKANHALIDLMSAFHRYGQLHEAIMIHPTPADELNAKDDPLWLEQVAVIRDAEQAFIAFLSAVMGPPDVHFPDEDE